MDYTRWVGLDFETYSATDLKVHGLERYVTDPHFKVLIARLRWYDNFGALLSVGFDFIQRDPRTEKDRLIQHLDGKVIVAQNAGFEQRVLQAIGIYKPSTEFVDSAVVARMAGAGGSLEAAAPQLLGMDKLEQGKNLIRLFCMPSKEQVENGDLAFDENLVVKHQQEWVDFDHYCDVDAELGLRLALEAGVSKGLVTAKELVNQAVTMDMNLTGWPVDLDSVKEMQRRYLENQEKAVAHFRDYCQEPDLNLNSLKQLKEWCAKRGIKASSFNEKSVEKLLKRLDKKVAEMDPSDAKYDGYVDVQLLLETKQILGGSSLKKLAVILNTVGPDGRLHDQYMHVGAGQTYRTTGRSVQMQNLKRLGEELDDVEELQNDEIEWDNSKLAENLRQLFTSSHPDGALIVGDFSSIESRGLAWLARAYWKLRAYKDGKDMYKVLAQKIYPGVAYEAVTKPQRQTGKVGELSCGYGAGAGAVKSFAEGMGVILSEDEAAKLVHDWRQANPEIVNFWAALDSMLAALMAGHSHDRLPVGEGFELILSRMDAPASLVAMHPRVFSLLVEVRDVRGDLFLSRVFHGLYKRGNNICYYKPTERKTGDVWKRDFVDPKTKERKFYTIYGGKLAGILTQSFCREMFFNSLRLVDAEVREHGNLDLIGQFHDEIVLDWQPGVAAISREGAMRMLETLMTRTITVTGFPMAAEIKYDYRYTK